MKKQTIYFVLYTMFALDYFIVSDKEDRTTTCVFWTTLVVFNIWLELMKRNDLDNDTEC